MPFRGEAVILHRLYLLNMKLVWVSACPQNSTAMCHWKLCMQRSVIGGELLLLFRVVD